MNQTFVTMAIAKELDGATNNPLYKRMMVTIVAAKASGRPGQLLYELPQNL